MDSSFFSDEEFKDVLKVLSNHTNDFAAHADTQTKAQASVWFEYSEGGTCA